MTAYMDEEKIEAIKHTMPFGYISKPAQEKDLKVTIEMALAVAKADAERTRVEQELMRSEQALRNVVEHSTNIFFSHTTDHVLTYMSPQTRDVLGYEPEEAMVNWTELASDNPINEVGFQITQKAINSGVRQPPYELELLHKTGRKVLLEIRESPIVVDGKTTAIVGSGTDISEYKAIIKSLQASEQDYMSFIEDSPVSIVVAGDDMKILYVNKLALELSEYSEEEVLKLTIPDLLAPSDLEMAISKWSRRENTENPNRTFEISIISKSRKLFQSKLYWVSLIWEGKPAYLYYLNDITENKKAEKALVESEEKFRTVVEHMNEGLAISDGNFEIIYVNQILCDTLGYSESELKSLEKRNLFTEESFKLLLEHRQRVSRGEVSSCVLEAVRKDGTLLNILLSATPIMEAGKLRKSVSIFTNITDLKQHERVLEHRVRERTLELVVAKEKAERADRLKSEFLANISHELRTPLHSILSYSRYGYENFSRKDDEKLIGFFKSIFTSGDRLMGLLNDLLDLSKLQADKMIYQKSWCSLNLVIDDMKAEFSILAKEKNLSWQITNAQDADVLVDANKIKQVVSNLFSNVIKYSDADSTIEVVLEGEADQVQVSIQNQGVPIPKAELEHIFDPFIQSSRTQTGAGGTGLGLPICKKIIEDHSGRIWAETTVNGAIMRFFLPRESQGI